MMEEEAVNVSKDQHDLMTNVMKDNATKIESIWPDDSCQRILWEQQAKFAKLKGASGMRWHPMMIRWCIALFAKSGAAYRQLGDSGFLHLPHVTTLQSYMRFTKPRSGINKDVLDLLVQEMNIPQLKDFKKNVCLNWDEMRIKSGLVLSKSTGKLVGFCDLDTFNEELLKMSNSKVEFKPDIATHIIVFMVRGLFSSHNVPFMWYPCKGFHSEQLWDCVWRATHILEDLGLKVRAWVSDGASSNRKFFRIHRAIGGQYMGATYYCTNRYAPHRKIYFICDVPHLLKTARNNIENSHGNQNTKHLMKNGKEIKWPHIVSTVLEDKSRALVKLKNIREEHINISPQLRMRVRLAAQVLSKSMAEAIRARNNDEMLETAQFCDHMNIWFDCLNGRNFKKGYKERNHNLHPYQNINDRRFAYLNDFLQYINEWEEEVENIPDMSLSEKNRLKLSYQTVEGLRITTVAFPTLTKELLQEAPPGTFLLAEKLNQDKL